MTDTVEALFDEYTRRYVAFDVSGVADLCLVPFVAVREGKVIPMPDRVAVEAHFSRIIAGYRDAGFGSFSAIELDNRPAGERSSFVTARWLALDSAGSVARDSRTTYHLVLTDAGWRFLSYTNHF